MKNHQSRDLIQSPPKGINSIHFNAMETGFYYEIIPLSLDIIFLAMPALTQEISVVMLQQQRRKKELNKVGALRYILQKILCVCLENLCTLLTFKQW